MDSASLETLMITDVCRAVRASQVALVVKNRPTKQETQETWVQSLGREDPLEEDMATRSRLLAWEIP